MIPASIDSYLRLLDRELRRRFVFDPAILDEVREHLADAVARERELGQSLPGATAAAIARFGAPAVVAEAHARDRSRLLYRALLGAALAIGIAIAWVDSRPNWDDTGITAGALLVAAGFLGLAGPRRPWAWALLVGIWIPVLAFIRTPAIGTLPMLLVLLFPFAGAYLGMLVRRALTAVRS